MLLLSLLYQAGSNTLPSKPHLSRTTSLTFNENGEQGNNYNNLITSLFLYFCYYHYYINYINVESPQPLWQDSAWSKLEKARGKVLERANSFVGTR